MAYVTQTDIENALGVNTVKAVYDDDRDGAADATPVAACIAYASAEVDSFLEPIYGVTLPLSPVPDVVKYAAVDFACAYTARRRPDLFKAAGGEPWDKYDKSALAKMDRFVKSKQVVPPTTATPENVGGTTVRATSADATYPRVFDDFGDY